RYAPFGAEELPGGRTNPAFRRSLVGWLLYVRAVASLAERVFGSDGFDLEIGGSYSPFLGTSRTGKRRVVGALLESAVSFLRNRLGVSPRVAIADGYTASEPSSGGSLVP